VTSQVTVRFWAGARRAAGHAEEPMTAASLAELRDQLASRAELTAIVAASSFLVDGEQAPNDVPLPYGAIVDVLPPFAGGAPDDRTQLTAYVSGYVQGVGFRAWACDVLSKLGLSGSARNLDDGRVEVTARGAHSACEQLLTVLRGPRTPGRVDGVEATYT
jgi:acylphosphatase